MQFLATHYLYDGACGAVAPKLAGAYRTSIRMPPGLSTLTNQTVPSVASAPPDASLVFVPPASITRGLTNKDIAVELGISVRSVDEHVNAILSKIGAANRTEAVAIALKKQLLKI